MSNFDMRIPVRELKVLRWQEGRVVLELRPAFASVDPIIVEIPEAAMSGFRQELAAFQPAPDSASPAPLPRALPDRVIRNDDNLADGAPAHQLPLGDSRFTGTFATIPEGSREEDDLTEEELSWLARSAG
ncbi:hypothetical protein [Camelimonas lactis]|nr:hypothetical protein [Camelimonas lactis]